MKKRHCLKPLVCGCHSFGDSRMPGMILRWEGLCNDLFTKERNSGDSLGIYCTWYNNTCMHIYIYTQYEYEHMHIWVYDHAYVYIYIFAVHDTHTHTDLEYLVILSLTTISSGSLWRLGRYHKVSYLHCGMWLKSQTLWPRHSGIYRLLPSQKLQKTFPK